MYKIFFGFSDCIEPIADGRFFIRFDSFSSRDFEKVKKTKDIEKIIYEIKTILIEIYIEEDDIHKYFTGITNSNIPENQWFLIKFGEQGLNAKYYEDSTDDSNNEKDCKISQIILLEKNGIEAEILKRKFAFPLYENNISIKDIISDKPLSDVICLNVGQGNCNAILGSSCELLGFFDFGGGVGSNYVNLGTGDTVRHYLMSYYSKENPPFIILSHWDLDHFCHYKKYEDKILKFIWIVPYFSSLGKSHLELLYKIKNNNNLFVYDNSMNSFISNNKISLHKLLGKNKNNSGLSVLLDLESTNHVSYKVLLPGDASYMNIPISKDIELNGLVASHHGGHTMIKDNPPKAAKEHLVAYSYGEKNRYGHPNCKSIELHNKFGWKNIKCTTSDEDICMMPEKDSVKILQILKKLGEI